MELFPDIPDDEELTDAEFLEMLALMWPDVGRIDTGSAGPTDLHAEDV